MTGSHAGEAAMAYVLENCPSLRPPEALAFLYICAGDSLSLKALSKNMGEGQSAVTRYVAALAQTGAGGPGLVVLSDLVDGQLRRTVCLSATGLVLRDKVNNVVSLQT